MKSMKKDKRNNTRFNFSIPSFLTGMGSVLSIGGNYYKLKQFKNNNRTDIEALWSDWNVIGDDIRSAAKHFNKEIHPSN